MYFNRFLPAALAATTASATIAKSDGLFALLLKRQEPGTPAYNCHDNCGQAIIQAREDDDVCNDEAFVSNYENCLQCAGPDNVGIWQYYGNSLSSVGESCDLDTEPAAGEQDDVGAAIPAETGDSSSSTSGTSPPESEPTGESENPPETEGGSEDPTESEGGSETPTSGNGEDSDSPSSTDIPETDTAGSLEAGFAGVFMAAFCAGGLLM